MPLVDPTLTLGREWQIGPVEAPEVPAGTAGTGSTGFGDALGQALGSLQASQEEAAQGAQALATGTASDPTAVVMSVERARLAMQLASQIRTKGIEALQDVFHTQV